MASRPRILLGIVALFSAMCAVATAARHAPSTTLEVGWISREPRFRAPATLDGPKSDGWPGEGRAVHWIGHVLNRGAETAADVPFAWSVDGVEVLRGAVDLTPGDNEIIFPWVWTFTRHQIGLSIAPPADIGDSTTEDDRVAIDSDALAIGFYIDQSEYNILLRSHLGSFERRMQRQIPYWNSVLADAVYPTTPNGALDRVRLDKVVVVPDRTPFNDEDYFDTDLIWRFPAWGSFFGGMYDSDQTILLHELLHQRGLVDNYAYEVAHYHNPGIEGGQTMVIENGRAIVGTPALPALPDTRNIGGIFLFKTPAEVEGVMGHGYFRGAAKLTEVCANGLNLWAGRRTPVSRWPVTGGIVLPMKLMNANSYVNRMPSVTSLTFTDDGKPITGGVVDVFLDQNGHAYRDTYSAEPQVSLHMDADGAVTLPGDLLDDQPPARQPAKAQTMLLRVRTGSARGYVFVPLWSFNRQYFRDRGGPSALQVAVRMSSY
jgi:hypothetical protein